MVDESGATQMPVHEEFDPAVVGLTEEEAYRLATSYYDESRTEDQRRAHDLGIPKGYAIGKQIQQLRATGSADLPEADSQSTSSDPGVAK